MSYVLTVMFPVSVMLALIWINETKTKPAPVPRMGSKTIRQP